jgi:D-alanine-D-alanine ligase
VGYTEEKIIVLKGGISSERNVSLQSGAAVAKALRDSGCSVQEWDLTEREFQWPDREALYFVCLHGTFGEDGEIQERMEKEGIRFTGAGAEACRCAFDKLEAKDAFRRAGLAVPEGRQWNEEIRWDLPYVLKPVADGSSVGVQLVLDPGDVDEAILQTKRHGGRYMIERYVDGRELTVGVLGDQALPIVEIRPLGGFYDYDHKYTDGMTEHFCPAPLEKEVAERLQAAALKAHRAVGCEVYSRVDFLLADDGEIYVLEINTIPGMTPLSLLPEAANAAGISFVHLCTKIIELSLEARS